MEIDTGIPLTVMMKLCCKTSSLNQRLKTWTLLQRYHSLLSFPINLMNLQKYFSLTIHQDDLASPTHQTFCLLCRVQIYHLVHIPSHKCKTFQTTTFVWVFFPQMTLQLITINPPPIVSIHSTSFENGTTLSLPWSIYQIISRRFWKNMNQ